MGLYRDQVVPRVTNRVMDDPELAPLRARACAGLSGRVLELGFGSGLNVVHYPPEVTEVVAVEPSDVAWRLAGPRVATAAVPVQRDGLDALALPFADASVDAALSSFTVCTIPDPARALAEVARVLKPGGVLHFVEHGLAPDEDVRRWQGRIAGVNAWVQGGCRIDRPVDALLAGAGFTVEQLDRSYLVRAPRPFAAIYEGRTRRS